MKHNNVIIIGSGIGGLVCGDILSREGYSVCIIEKNRQLGGCLQVYARDKVVFDSGVHYVGGLAKGQNLYQLFKYLGIIGKMKLERMDADAFDKIMISGDDKVYALAQGYDNFIATLLKDFPEEEAAINTYCDKIKEVCSKFPLYNLEAGDGFDEKLSVMSIDTKTYLASITENKKLQQVLAGNNALYAGVGNETPFYVHALITNSYIESSWKFVDGGSQIAKYMAANIRAHGGKIINNATVTKIVEQDGRVTHVLLQDGTALYADHFISNMHPAKTIDITETTFFKTAYKNRIKSLKDTISGFIVNIVLKKDCFPYFKHNYYWHREGHLWSQADYTAENWPLGYAIFLSATSKIKACAEGFTIFSYMRYEDVQQWENTFNTVTHENDRGESYEAFKKEKAERLIDVVCENFPQLRDCISTYYVSTPLTFRDYIGTDDGSLYGIAKDYKEPLKTFMSPRTKLPNLYFTGQNLNLHGVLGAAISGIVTSTAVMNSNEIIKKIKDA